MAAQNQTELQQNNHLQKSSLLGLISAFIVGVSCTLVVEKGLKEKSDRYSITISFNEQAQEGFQKGKGDTLQLNKAFIKARNIQIKNAIDKKEPPAGIDFSAGVPNIGWH